jgi:site-specific DNA recombinase
MANDRAVLYLRQSVAREESISLELQEFEGRAYAKSRGYEVVAVESDPGISGRTWNRPAVKRVMDMADRKEVDVIILWKWSRLSRSRLDWAVANDRVATAGGRIESATEPLDTTTATGRFARGMLTEMAAFESERIGDTWREAHARRLRNGMPANGRPRFGYKYSSADGFTVDPMDGPVLAEMFRRYIAGESVYALVQWLNEGPTHPSAGYGPPSDGLWSDRTVRRVMDSGFAAGLLRSKGEYLPGAHDAIIDADEWEAYKEARQRRRSYRRGERSAYLMSGMVWCHCGSKMHAGQFGTGRLPKFRCKDAYSKRLHSGGYVSETVLEAALHKWLTERSFEINTAAAMAAVVPARKPADSRVISIDSKLATLSGKMDRLAERLIDPGIPFATYTRLRDKYEEERKALEESRLAVAAEERIDAFEVIPNLLANWDDGLLEEKREILRALKIKVVVMPMRPVSRVVISSGL